MTAWRWPLLLGGIVLVAGLTGWYLWQQTWYPSTDDAYVDAHVVRIAAQVSGPVRRVEVSDHQAVQAGDLLFEIDPAPFKIALQRAEAQLAQSGSDVAATKSAIQAAREQVNQAQAAYDNAVRDDHRIQSLMQSGAVSRSDSDHAQAKLDSTHAALLAAQATLKETIVRRGKTGADNAQTQVALARVAQARLNLSWTQVRAPVAGILSGLELRPGSTVASGQPLFALVDTSTWWINANFKETDLRHIEPGRPADITVDMYPGKHFHGVVDSISPASGSAFSLLPPENATGNWVKVTQRIPVRVRVLDPDPAHPLRIGASSSVTVDARGEVSGAPGQP